VLTKLGIAKKRNKKKNKKNGGEEETYIQNHKNKRKKQRGRMSNSLKLQKNNWGGPLAENISARKMGNGRKVTGG